MFYFPYDPIEEENESKLSSEGEIRTDVSNTDESFELNLQQYVEICDEPNENMIGTKLDIDCVMREIEEDKKDSDQNRMVSGSHDNEQEEGNFA